MNLSGLTIFRALNSSFSPSKIIFKQTLGFGIFIFLFFVSCKKETEDDDMVACQNDIVIELLNSTDAPCGETSGKIELVVSANVEYSIDQISFNATGVFENLSPGLYTVVAKDENDCEETKEFRIVSGVSLSAEVIPIIEVTCAIAGCHVAGEQSPDFTLKENVISASQAIKSNVTSNTMPPADTAGPPLSAEDMETIVCWIEDGANDN